MSKADSEHERAAFPPGQNMTRRERLAGGVRVGQALVVGQELWRNAVIQRTVLLVL